MYELGGRKSEPNGTPLEFWKRGQKPIEICFPMMNSNPPANRLKIRPIRRRKSETTMKIL
jgi:hypothetical protein